MRTRVVLEGAEALPRTPVLLVSNAAHMMDWFFLHDQLTARGIYAPILSKGKNWHEPLARFGCDYFGALPMVSRGYILSVDLKQLLDGERPSEALYRAVRAHVDQDAPLDAQDPVIHALLHTPRELLGVPFDPATQRYGEFVRELYFRFQNEHLLRLGREVVDQGHWIHVYPQGTVSSRLSRGRIGAIQLARALDLPILPVGLNGIAEAFLSPSLPLLRFGKEVTMRFGAPIPIEDFDLPKDLVPFLPEHEALHREPLQRATDQIMERINALLDPQYQWAPDRQSDGKQGVKRFV